MKKSIVFFLIVFYTTSLFSQEKNAISIEFSNLNILESIQLLEQKTNYKFFFIESWLEKEKRINKNFSNSSIENILTSVFSNTSLNFYILNNKVILTRNSIIRDTNYAPNNKSKDNLTNSIVEKKPLLIDDNTSSTERTVKIGKETASSRKYYQLKGKVYNSNTKLPISNLVVHVKKINKYVTTNKKGEYTITLPYGENIIETVLSGYKVEKVKLLIYGDGNYNFTLQEDNTLLDEVVVKSNPDKNVKSLATGVSKLKAEKIKIIPQVLGERNLIKAVTTLPGIRAAGEASEGIHVRGGKSDQNLFLLDNTTLYNPNHFFGIFSAVNPYTTNDLKVYKGNIPAKYGGRVSSVFEIESKNSNTEKFGAEASLGLVSSNISLDIPIVKGKSGLLLGGRSTYSDWILKAVDRKELEKSSASFYDIYANYTHKINDNNKIVTAFFYSNDKYRIASDSTNSYQNQLASFKWSHKINDKNKGDLTLSKSNYSFNINFDSDNLTNNFDIDYSIDEFNLRLDMNYNRSKKMNFDYGLESKLYEIKPGTISPFGSQSSITPFSVQNEKAIENSVYISGNLEFNDKLSFSLGGRYTLFSSLGASTQRTYDETKTKSDGSVIFTTQYANNEIFNTYKGLSFRLSARYLLDDDLSLKASFNNSYQFIHRLTNNTSATPTDTWTLSNPNVKPQEATQTSIGVYKNLTEDIQLSLEGYYRSYKNLVDYKVGSSFLLNEFIETEILQGPGESYGLEFLAKKNFGDLNGWLSYTYSRSFLTLDGRFPQEIVNNGNPFPSNFDQPHDLNLVLNYKLTERYSFSSNFVYQTGRPITYPVGKYTFQNSDFVVYSDRNKYRIPDYYRLDIGFNIEGNHKKNKLAHSFWSISIYNVLGRNNPYSIFFLTEDGVVNSYQSSIFSRPIPTISYNLKF